MGEVDAADVIVVLVEEREVAIARALQEELVTATALQPRPRAGAGGAMA
jgi:hypothetical protein